MKTDRSGNRRGARRWVCLPAIVLLWQVGVARILAASPHMGFYSGYLYAGTSGILTLPESPIGPAFYTVDSEGHVRGSAQGTVDAVGNLVWQANDLGFTTGTIAGGVLSATASRQDGGTITTYRIEARNTATGFGTGGTVAQGFSWRLPDPVGPGMRGVTWGDGKYVAVGPAGAVAVSGNGTDWVSASTPTSVQLNAVAHGLGTFVAVGDAASVFTSRDGLAWTPRNLNADLVKQNVAGVAFGAGTFVAVNLVNEVYVSPDGVQWTKIGSAPTGVTTWNNLKFVGNRFVLVGGLANNGVIATSANGVNWSATRTLASTGGILDVAYGNGRWVGVNLTRYFTFTVPDGSDAAAGAFAGLGDAVGFVNGTFVSDNRYVSSDGIRWTRGSYPDLDINDMVMGADRLVAVGGAVTSTTDGRHWRIHSRPMPAAVVNNTYRHQLGDGTVTGDVFAEIEYYVQGSPRWLRMGVGGLMEERVTVAAPFVPTASPTSRTLRDGYGSTTTALGVGDGGTIVRFGPAVNSWTNVPTGTTADLVSVAARNGDNLVVVGRSGTILRTSDGGRTWTPASSGTDRHLNRVAYLSGVGFNYYLAVGDQGVVLKSADGASWTALDSGTTVSLVGAAKLVSGANQVLVLARDSTALVSSDHGGSWRAVPVHAPYPLVFQEGGVGYGEDGFIMRNLNGTGTNWIYTLPDVGPLVGAAFGADRFVVLSARHWHVSSDLRNWRTIPSKSTHESVVYGGGQFVSVGLGDSATRAGYVSTSVDGSRWVERVTPTTVILKGVAYGNGKYVAVGQNGTILSSSDGVTWINRTIAGTQELKSVAYGNGRFVAVGVSGALRHSSDGESWSSSGSGTSSTLWGVTYGRGLFVAVGDSAGIRTSTNGTSWTARGTTPSTSASRTYRAVRYVGGRYIAMGVRDGAGNGAVLAHSLDGIAWTKETVPTSEDILGMASGNGTVIALGNAGMLLAANYEDVDAPLVTGQPADRVLNAGETLQLSATVVGALPMTFRWLRDGVPLSNGGNITGADTLSLTVVGVGASDAGDYVLEASNEAGGRLSRGARVRVSLPPRIVLQPQSATRSPGSSVAFAVAVVGEGPFTYLWSRNGAPVVDSGGISGQGTATLAIRDIRAADAGFYTVTVSNGVSAESSRVAALSVQSLVEGGVDLALDAQFAANVPPLLPTTIRNSATSSLTLFNPESGVVQPDGKLIIVGTFEYGNAAGQTRYGIIRLNVDGSLDTGFAPPLLEGLRGGSFYSAAAMKDVALMSDGRIVAVGELARAGGVQGATLSSGLVVLNPDGSRVTGFAPAGMGYLYSVAVDSRDRVLVAGNFNLPVHRIVARLTSDGAFDGAFQTKSLAIDDFFADTLLIQPPDDRVLIHVSTGGYTDSKVIRLRNDGALDGAFQSVSFGGSPLYDLQTAPSGGILAPGRYPTADGQDRRGLSRLGADGGLDPAFGNPGAGSTVNPSFLNAVGFANGAMIVGGTFRNILGASVTNLALLNGAGALIPSPTIGGGTDGSVLLVVGSADRRSIFVAGNVTNLSGVRVSRVFRLEATVGGDPLPLSIAALSSGQSLTVGSTVVLSVAAVGTGSLEYQWRKGGDLLPGRTGAQLVLENVRAEDAGDYSVVITDRRGSLTSPGIPLTLGGSETFSFSQWLADKELVAGVSDGPDHDPDQDGLPNLLEFAFGTHPNQPGSVSVPRAVTVNVGGIEFPGVRFQRNRLAAGIRIHVEVSGTVLFPGATATVALPPVDLGDQREEITLRAETPLGATGSIFFHTKVTQP